MPDIPTTAQIIARHLAAVQPPAAIVFVDGQDVLTCDSEAEARAYITATQPSSRWREISLMVYKPRYGSYLRSLMMTR